MKLHWGLAGTEAAGMAQYNQSASANAAATTERRDRTGLCFMIGPICILDLLRRAAFSLSRLQHPISACWCPMCLRPLTQCHQALSLLGLLPILVSSLSAI